MQPVLGPVLLHNGEGDDDRNVVGGFGRQNAARPQFPEVRVTGALHSALDVDGSAIVGGDREVPIAELIVKIVEVVSGGARGHFRIHPVIGVAGLHQPVLLPAKRHELPHAAGGGAGHRPRHEAGFGLRQVDQLARYSFFVQDSLNHGPIAARALLGGNQGAMAAGREVVDVAEDGVGNGEGELRNAGFDLLADSVLQLRIHREGHVQDVFERRLFELLVIGIGGCAHAGQIQTVDVVDELFEFAIVVRAISRLFRRRLNH